jgi:hypothetical protein
VLCNHPLIPSNILSSIQYEPIHIGVSFAVEWWCDRQLAEQEKINGDGGWALVRRAAIAFNGTESAGSAPRDDPGPDGRTGAKQRAGQGQCASENIGKDAKSAERATCWVRRLLLRSARPRHEGASVSTLDLLP